LAFALNLKGSILISQATGVYSDFSSNWGQSKPTLIWRRLSNGG